MIPSERDYFSEIAQACSESLVTKFASNFVLSPSAQPLPGSSGPGIGRRDTRLEYEILGSPSPGLIARLWDGENALKMGTGTTTASGWPKGSIQDVAEPVPIFTTPARLSQRESE